MQVEARTPARPTRTTREWDIEGCSFSGRAARAASFGPTGYASGGAEARVESDAGSLVDSSESSAVPARAEE
jgi:hypothetical protein